jgi:hypothetical protein
MMFEQKPWLRGIAACAALTLLPIPQTLAAQQPGPSPNADPDHLVSATALQTAAADASCVTQQNRDALDRFFSSDKATRALEASHMSPQQVRSAVAALNDQELAQLASRANKAQSEFAAGNMSDRDLLIILVAIAALILIIVAVR